MTVFRAGLLLGILVVLWTFVMGFTGWYRHPSLLFLFWLVIPLQVAVLLSEPGRDFEGGEFVLTEQRPRMQSRVEVVPLGQGDAVVFPVSQRPVRGSRGLYRVNMRHGVSRLRAGKRHTLGIIFHDGK